MTNHQPPSAAAVAVSNPQSLVTVWTRRLRPLFGPMGLALASLAVVACGGLTLRTINHSAQRPSNVAVYFTVDDSDDKPVAGLTAEKFTIYEDGSKVSEFESKQTILNPTVAASHYTLLLIDMSGSIVESDKVGDIVAASSRFTERVEKFQKVGVAAFDGSAELYPIVPFTESGNAAQGGVERLKTFKPRDPSTNLHGAVIKGLEILRKSLAADPKPLKFGTLVVFTDGTDRANRVSRDEMRKALNSDENKAFDIYAIGVGGELKNSGLDEIGRSGTVLEGDPAKTGQAFDKIASKIEGMTQRYYLLSYCTPSRAGEHEVRIVAKTDRESGALTYRFNADGFGPNCDPNTPPSFSLAAPAVPLDERSGSGGGAGGRAELKAGARVGK